MRQSNHKTGFQRGFSLIEMMISITIGLLILVALTSMFVNESKSRVELDKSNRMIDNGRYAAELISGNLELAGFYDGLGSSNLSHPVPPAVLPNIYVPLNIYDPCDVANLTKAAVNLDILRLAVQGYNAATVTSQVTNAAGAAVPPCSGGTTPLTYTAGSAGSIKIGTDILTLRRASTATPLLQVAAGPVVAGTEYLQVSMCTTSVAAPYLLATGTAATFNLKKSDCVTGAHLRPFMVTTYFISPDDDPAGSYPTGLLGARPASCTGDCIPTLKQIDQYGNITPLVEGIEYMHIDYGIDNFGGGSASTDVATGTAPAFTNCSACTLQDWSNVVSVRINLLARNTEQTNINQINNGQGDTKTYVLGGSTSTPADPPFTVGSFNDAYKRHVYTQLVRLTNPSGRRDNP